ncbi:MAG: Histidine N-alpha-methyltransferase [Alphaproteobacteria bacterium MarineAlpha9_Bin3]|nr:MAG: Histidine N-alpha-methyltransferase [Alphaproteobacteria bacterium MarineAlpha9_Bin3]|tara:strand:+ start:7160 stop:8143 length:984 start_codon:yes stop_codon:yes gene_type:complete
MKIKIIQQKINKKQKPIINIFARDIDKGLSLKNKALSSKYFYDDKGSKIFQKITQHPDYYLTRKEIEILNKIKSKLPKLFKLDEIDIIELGPGDGSKSKIIIDGFIKYGCFVNYYPIDISLKALKLLNKNFKNNNNLNINGIVSEYFEGLKFVKKLSKNKQLILFLGSNIGNFEREQSIKFMKNIYNNIKNKSYILTGFDLKKDPKKLNKAYNDSSKFTEKFNLNLLSRINKQLKGDFNLNNFIHYGTYNPLLGAMESFLISTKRQTVYIELLNKKYSFECNEPIHLEYSFKFSLKDIEYVAYKTGFKIEYNFLSKDNGFINSLWEK